jgi:putative ABC transport system substrate-binding protein
LLYTGVTRGKRLVVLVGQKKAVAAWPLVAWAQQAAMPVIGFLHSGSPDPFTHMVAAFRQGLKEEGYIDGQNVTRRT